MHITGDQYQRMQDDFKDIKLIIIDEYSMVGRAILATVDFRYQDIFAKNEPFWECLCCIGGWHAPITSRI